MSTVANTGAQGSLEKRSASPLIPEDSGPPSNLLTKAQTAKRFKTQGGRQSRKHQHPKKRHADQAILEEIESLFTRLLSEDEGGRPETAAKRREFASEEDEKDWYNSPPVPDVFSKLRRRQQQQQQQQQRSEVDTQPESSADASFADVHVLELTSGGMGLATLERRDIVVDRLRGGSRAWVYVVPFVLPGETAHIKVFRNFWGYSQCDLESVKEPSQQRVEPPCKYFSQCSGCQLQHWGYANQLEFKRRVVENAFLLAHRLLGSTVPVLPVIASPQPLHYRTKLTPHFDLPKGSDIDAKDLLIGFNHHGRRQVLDIEQCVISTEAVNRGLVAARDRTREAIKSYKRGATLLIRETNEPLGAEKGLSLEAQPASFEKSYVLDPKAQVTEVVGHYQFKFPASSFFQNNNLILPAFTGYVRDELRRLGELLVPLDVVENGDDSGTRLRYLVDAYCGAGLFGIACSKGFEKVIGIEISRESISCANDNAKLNNLSNCEFILGDAAEIFKKVPHDAAQTAVIIDPPRKGSNPAFLDQLVGFKPAVIIYVACGVPAQARDLKYLMDKGALVLEGSDSDCQEGADELLGFAKYKMMAIQPFDLFPQTAHVENIVSLVRTDLLK
ncbi:tRNA(m5U54)methyltransferase [Spiromyces aspiralis]|uniref:tRNA(M5U54)methyltransferase n=1 Tax=Spiromyces aspiralis TaxID=68401 RepID=A0ACC1HD38_9FUNG|nr:tRNA(m5U54)methyltransferase [Spiromyces aspiralis]